MRAYVRTREVCFPQTKKRNAVHSVANTCVGSNKIRVDLIFNLFPSIWKMENAIRTILTFPDGACRSALEGGKKYIARETRLFALFTVIYFRIYRERRENESRYRSVHIIYSCINSVIIFQTQWRHPYRCLYFYTVIKIKQRQRFLTFRAKYSSYLICTTKNNLPFFKFYKCQIEKIKIAGN